MKQSFTLGNLQAILFFPFTESGGRKKLLIASVIGFASFIVPILPTILLMGYSGLIMRSIIVDKKQPHLPEWDNWNGMLSLGARLFGVNFIYSFPVAGSMLLGYLLLFIPVFMSGFYESGSGQLPPSFWNIALFAAFAGMALFSLGMLLGLVLWIVLPPAFSHAAAHNSFAAGFQVREWWKILKANPGGFVLSLVLAGGLYMLLVLAIQIVYMTIILCILVPFLLAFAGAYLGIVVSVLFAQAYREGVDKLESQAA